MQAKKTTETVSLVLRAGIGPNTRDGYAIVRESYTLASAIASKPGMLTTLQRAIEERIDGSPAEDSVFLRRIRAVLRDMPNADCPVIRRVLQVKSGSRKRKTDMTAWYLPESSLRHI